MLAGTGLFIGCIITGIESALAAEDIEEYCEGPYRNSDNNKACEQLERIYNIVLALTVSICVTRPAKINHVRTKNHRFFVFTLS